MFYDIPKHDARSKQQRITTMMVQCRAMTHGYKASLRDVGELREEGVAKRRRPPLYFNHRGMLLKVTNKA